MRVFMVYWTLYSEFGDFEDMPIGVFRSPQEVATATHESVPANMEDWGKPNCRLRSNRYRMWDFDDNAVDGDDCTYTVAECHI